MKKIIFLAILSLLLLNASAVKADVSVRYPATFTLKVSEKATVTNYLNMQIKLQKVEINPVTNYIQNTGVLKSIQVIVSNAGGCGPNADPRCLGAPPYEDTFTISENGSIKSLALNIKVTDISSDNATFVISIPSNETSPSIPIITPVVIPRSGGFSDDVSLSSILNLSDGQEIISAEEIKATSDVPAYYKVKTKRKARLFFIFPVHPEITYSVNSETRTNTIIGRPWWNFLAW